MNLRWVGWAAAECISKSIYSKFRAASLTSARADSCFNASFSFFLQVIKTDQIDYKTESLPLLNYAYLDNISRRQTCL